MILAIGQLHTWERAFASSQERFDFLRSLASDTVVIMSGDVIMGTRSKYFDPAILECSLAALTQPFRDAGLQVESSLRFEPEEWDLFVDEPPYELGHHLRIFAGENVITSVVLVARKR
jgi:hypothetical protein